MQTAAIRVLVGFLAVTSLLLGSDWKVFRSTLSSFEVNYPSSWYLFKTDEQVFDILNFPPSERINGVVLKEGGAEITALGMPSKFGSLEQWINHDAQSDETLEKSTQEISNPPVGGCKNLSRLKTKSEVAGGKHFIYTSLYCTTNHGNFRVMLVNWENDPNQSRNESLLRKVALSLREIPRR